ncbi:MAG: YceD family protein, partial [Bradymonadaceae bacterium]
VLMSRPSWGETYETVEEIELSAEDLDVSFYEGDLIDLRDLIREAVLLELPVFPNCSEELRDACDAAYQANVGAETLEKNEDNKIDLRWSALKNIKLGDDSKKDTN